MFEKKFLMSLLCLVVVLSLSATATRGANILFVASMSVAEDDVLKAYMEGLGHTVTYIDDDEDEATTEAAAAAADVVFISESVSSGKIKNEITELEIPMVVGEPYAWDEMGLTEGGGGDDAAVTTDIEIVDPGHYLAAGLSGTVTVLTEILAGCNLGKGITGPEATVIATATLADGVTYDVIFVYEKGAALAVAPGDGSAPVAADIRIGIGFHANCYPALSDNYYSLLGAAVDYALGVAGPAEPPALLLRYPFNEGVGDRVGDVSGNDNHAVMHNMDDTSWVEGKEAGFGTCLALDGIDDYLTTDGFFSEPLDGDFTLSMWFTGTPGRRARLFGLRSGDALMVNVRILENDILQIDDNGGVQSGVDGNVTVTDQQWHHFAIVRSGKALIAYLDGEPHLEAPLQEVVSMDNVSIGVRDRTGAQDDYLPGKVDEFSIYAEALDIDKIRFLMEHLVFAVEPPVAPSPIAHLKLDDNLNDELGNVVAPSLGGDAAFGPGVDGQALVLDGDGDYALLGPEFGAVMQPLTSFSASIWVNVARAQHDWPRVWQFGNSDNNMYVALLAFHSVDVDGPAGGPRFELKLKGAVPDDKGNNLAVNAAGDAITENEWTNIVTVLDDQAKWMGIYVNGLLAVEDSDFTRNPSMVDLYDENKIGTASLSKAKNYMTGSIDDLRIYDRALSEAEVSAIASGQ